MEIKAAASEGLFKWWSGCKVSKKKENFVILFLHLLFLLLRLLLRLLLLLLCFIISISFHFVLFYSVGRMKIDRLISRTWQLPRSSLNGASYGRFLLFSFSLSLWNTLNKKQTQFVLFLSWAKWSLTYTSDLFSYIDIQSTSLVYLSA